MAKKLIFNPFTGKLDWVSEENENLWDRTDTNLNPHTAGDDVGSTGTRINKVWATDLEVTNAITGDITGNSGTVTNGVYTTDFPLNQNTTGTASNLSGTPALPNGVTATTQSSADNSTKLATTQYVESAVSASGGGDVTKVGTPVNDQLGVWTGDGTIEGVAGLTYDGTNLTASETIHADINGNSATVTNGVYTSDFPLNQDTTGTSADATILETARTIGGVSFNGSANIDLPGVNTSGNQDTSGKADTAGNADTVTTNANLTGVVTSTGNATAIADKAIAVAKLADGTDGELITWDASGVVDTVAVGTANQVLTSNGVGAAPTFQDTSGDGDLLADGTIPLTADWDAGSHKITAEQLESDIATGTAPLVVASTTEVANLKSATVGTITGLAPDTATTQATQASITTCANLTTVGTIGTGTWQGTDVGIAYGGTGSSTLAGASIPTYTSTNTFTNKRITSRIKTFTSDATPDIDSDDYDAVTITALAVAITDVNVTGTPTNFQKLIFRIKDNATIRAIAWGSDFEDAGKALPITTVASKLLTVGFIYNTATSKWGCVAVANET